MPLRDAAPGVPDPVAAVVMRGLATEPADRFETAEAFGVALAEAATQAWGPGWLAAEQVPIMDAGPMTGAAGHLSGPRPAAGPTLSPPERVSLGPPSRAPGRVPPPPGQPSRPPGPQARPTGTAGSPAAPATVPGQRADALSQAPTYGGEGIAAAPGTEAAIPARSPATRRRVIIAVVVAVIVIILAIFLLPKLFTVYKSSPGLGPTPGPRPATAQLR